LPNATHEAVSTSGLYPWKSLTLDRWTMETLGGAADFELMTGMHRTAFRHRPLSRLTWEGEDALRLNVDFHEPQLTITRDGDILYRTHTDSSLYLNRVENPLADAFRARTYDFTPEGTNVTIHVEYWLPAEAHGDDCRCPLLRIIESRIEGFTSEPLVLRGYWSQTFNDVHLTNAEEFLFEPRLEEGLSAALLDELEAADIVQIYVNGTGMLFLVGLDGAPRRIRPL